MKDLICTLFASAVLSTAPGTQTFTGTITDELCADKAGHSQMRMGPTDAECTVACIDAHGAGYVLYDGRNVYTLSDQRTPEQFAGRRVRVTGTLDTRTRKIQVDSIRAAGGDQDSAPAAWPRLIPLPEALITFVVAAIVLGPRTLLELTRARRRKT
jgi:hypothetical protein